MVGIALVLGIAAVGLGLFASWEIDVPAGPAIVLAALAVFGGVRGVVSLTKTV